MRIVHFILPTAAVVAFVATSSIAASGSPVRLSLINNVQPIGGPVQTLRHEFGNGCPPPSTQYYFCIAPTLSQPVVVRESCEDSQTIMLSGNAFASHVKNGKLKGLVKNLPVALAPFSQSNTIWTATFSVVKKNPKTRHGVIKFAYALTITCSVSGSRVVLIGII